MSDKQTTQTLLKTTKRTQSNTKKQNNVSRTEKHIHAHMHNQKADMEQIQTNTK